MRPRIVPIGSEYERSMARLMERDREAGRLALARFLDGDGESNGRTINGDGESNGNSDRAAA